MTCIRYYIIPLYTSAKPCASITPAIPVGALGAEHLLKNPAQIFSSSIDTQIPKSYTHCPTRKNPRAVSIYVPLNASMARISINFLAYLQSEDHLICSSALAKHLSDLTYLYRVPTPKLRCILSLLAVAVCSATSPGRSR